MMTSERECYVYFVPPGATDFVTAGRFRWIDDGAAAVGQFVYGRAYRERADAVEFDPVELRLSAQVYETARMQKHGGAWLSRCALSLIFVAIVSEPAYVEPLIARGLAFTNSLLGIRMERWPPGTGRYSGGMQCQHHRGRATPTSSPSWWLTWPPVRFQTTKTRFSTRPHLPAAPTEPRLGQLAKRRSGGVKWPARLLRHAGGSSPVPGRGVWV